MKETLWSLALLLGLVVMGCDHSVTAVLLPESLLNPHDHRVRHTESGRVRSALVLDHSLESEDSRVRKTYPNPLEGAERSGAAKRN